MTRSLLLLAGFLPVMGCGGGYDDDVHRTVFVEVTSSPSGLPMGVSVGVGGEGEFDAPTPIARNVRVNVGFCRPLTTTGLVECVVYGVASVRGVDAAGKRVTMCLSDAGERDCATSNDGTVSVSMTIRVNA